MNNVELLWSLLETPARRKFVILLFLTTLSGFVEVLSVGLIIPFVAMASGSTPFGKVNAMTRWLLGILHSLGVAEKNSTLALGLVFLLGVVLANTYLCAYQYYAARVINEMRDNFSVRIIEGLNVRSLEWLDRENSSDLIKVSVTDVAYATSLANAVIQVAAIATRCCVVYVFFLITQARLAVAMVVSLAFLYRLVFRLIRRPIEAAGATAQETQAQMFRAASELVGGVRAVRTTATETHFTGRFSDASYRAIQPQVLRVMPSYLTRAGLETSTLAVVIGLLVHFNTKDGNLANGLPLLSSYAVAGIRLLPAVQQSLNFLLEIRFCAPSLREVARLLKPEAASVNRFSGQDDAAPLGFFHSLQFKNVTYGYDTSQPVLRNINLSIDSKKRTAFVGETGAGKSTMIDIILALRFPQEGCLSVDGIDILPGNARSWRKSIGYVPQSIYLLDASIAENIAFGLAPEQIDPERLRRACEAASLHTFVESLPESYNTFVGERGVRLSGGQSQRIGIARALYHDPEVVIFDEATSSLDSVTENSVLEAIDRLKGSKTLIVIAHRLNTVWDFDKIFVLERGELVGEGSASQLLDCCPTFRNLAEGQLNLKFQT